MTALQNLLKPQNRTCRADTNGCGNKYASHRRTAPFPRGRGQSGVYRGTHADRSFMSSGDKNIGHESPTYSRGKVQAALKRSTHQISPQRTHYQTLQVDEFWAFVGKKRNKVWLIYAYDQAGGEIVAHVWGKRDLATVMQLKQRLKALGVTYDRIATDNWAAFLKAFQDDEHQVGKRYTVGIEGNNCRLRQRMRRAVRKTCCFSKKMFYHVKAFAIGFFYINYGRV